MSTVRGLLVLSAGSSRLPSTLLGSCLLITRLVLRCVCWSLPSILHWCVSREVQRVLDSSSTTSMCRVRVAEQLSTTATGPVDELTDRNHDESGIDDPEM